MVEGRRGGDRVDIYLHGSTKHGELKKVQTEPPRLLGDQCQSHISIQLRG